MSALGHQLPPRALSRAAAKLPITDTEARGRRGRDGPIVLQKSLKPGRRFSRLKPTQVKVAARANSAPVTEVTDELSARSM